MPGAPPNDSEGDDGDDDDGGPWVPNDPHRPRPPCCRVRRNTRGPPPGRLTLNDPLDEGQGQAADAASAAKVQGG